MRCLAGWLVVLLGGIALAESNAPDPARVDEAIKGLRSKYYDERNKAKDDLVKMGAAVVPRVIQTLKDDDYRARAAACEILGALARPEALDPLVGALSDEDEVVKKAAIDAISNFGEAGRAALSHARETNPAVAAMIDDAMRQFTRVEVERLLDTRVTTKNGFGFYKDQFAKVLTGGKPAVDTLLEMFLNPDYDYQYEKDPDRQVILRVLAGEALGDSNDTSIVPKLKEFMQQPPDPNGLLLDAARYSLFKLGEKSFMEAKRLEILGQITASGGNVGDYYRAQLAEVYVRMGQFGEAEKEYKKVVNSEAKNNRAIYNLSCIYSLEGKKDEAVRTLRQAVEQGFDDYEWLRLDRDLDNIRGEAGYKAIMSEAPQEDKGADGPPREDKPKEGDDHAPH